MSIVSSYEQITSTDSIHCRVICYICERILFYSIFKVSFLLTVCILLYLMLFHVPLDRRKMKEKYIRSVFVSKFYTSHGDGNASVSIHVSSVNNETTSQVTSLIDEQLTSDDVITSPSTTLVCRQSSFSLFIKDETTLLNKPYATSCIFNLLNSTAQYFVSKVILSTFYSARLYFTTDYIFTDDDALLGIQWFTLDVNCSEQLKKQQQQQEEETLVNESTDDTSVNPLVILIIPDILEQDASSCYSHVIYSSLCRANVQAVALYQHRSSVNLPKLNDKCNNKSKSKVTLQHGDCSDLREAIKFIKQKYSTYSLTIIAYSSGCNLLLSYLGEFGSSSHVTSSVCISPWFDVQNVLFQTKKLPPTTNVQKLDENIQDENNIPIESDQFKSNQQILTNDNESMTFLQSMRIFREKIFILQNLIKLRRILSECVNQIQTNEYLIQQIDCMMSQISEETFTHQLYAQAYELMTQSIFTCDQITSEQGVTHDEEDTQMFDQIIGDCKVNHHLKQSDQGYERHDEKDQDDETSDRVNQRTSIGHSDTYIQEDYWTRNNPLRDVDDINTPVLFISSLDDPLVNNINIPVDIFKWFPNLLLIVTTSGTHESFIQFNGLTEPPVNWCDIIALDFLDASVKFVQQCTIAEIEERSNTVTPTPWRKKALTH